MDLRFRSAKLSKDCLESQVTSALDKLPNIAYGQMKKWQLQPEKRALIT